MSTKPKPLIDAQFTNTLVDAGWFIHKAISHLEDGEFAGKFTNELTWMTIAMKYIGWALDTYLLPLPTTGGLDEELASYAKYMEQEARRGVGPTQTTLFELSED